MLHLSGLAKIPFINEKIFSLPELHHGIKVLLVEDDPVARWLVRKTLRDYCELYTADCGQEAIRKYIDFKPDYVFLDIELPDKDGRQVLDWIMNKNPEAQVIMLSCHNDPDIISRTLEQGAKGFIAKPFQGDSLIRYVNPYNQGL